MPGLSIGLLGPLSVTCDGVPVPLASVLQRTVLALLSLQVDRVVSLDEISYCLWGDRPGSARNGVHVVMSRLRTRLNAWTGQGPGVVLSSGGGYRLGIAPDVIDAVRFDQGMERARATCRRDAPDDAGRLSRRALRLWRGPVLADVEDRVRSQPAARALAGRRLPAVLFCAGLTLDAGRPHEAVAMLRGLAAEEPLHEGVHAHLMLALAATGATAEALQVFDGMRRRLDRDLRIGPSSELRAARSRVLRQEPGTPSEVRQTLRLVPSAGEHLQVAEGGPPADLPADVPGFVGRQRAIEQLDAVLGHRPGDRPPAVVIHGMAGVGKTALAVHWGHQVSDRFPDGQVFLDLHGYDLVDAVEPLVAITSCLDALGARGRVVTADLGQAAARYRSALAGRRVLILLDNAGRAEQVRPLLPGTPGCLVLVTSRNCLTGLVATQGVRAVGLDVLGREEAGELLGTLLGPERVTADRHGTDRLVDACAGLPLALRIAAADLAEHPDRGLGTHAEQLCAGDRLGGLAIEGDDQACVRSAFEGSYRRLPPPAARLFRRLALVPGDQFGPLEVAALTGSDRRAARRLLDLLAAAHLIDRRGDAFVLHDLLRLYAGELVSAEGRPGPLPTRVRTAPGAAGPRRRPDRPRN